MLGDFWLIQLTHKAFLLNSSFPSKTLAGECLYRQVACVHSLPVYKGTKRRKGDPVLGYKKMLQIPPLSTSCCIYLSDHTIASRRGGHLEEVVLFQTPVAFKWANRAEEK